MLGCTDEHMQNIIGHEMKELLTVKANVDLILGVEPEETKRENVAGTVTVKKKTSAGCAAAPTVRYGGFGVLPNKQKPGGFLSGENRPVCRKGTTRHCLLLLV